MENQKCAFCEKEIVGHGNNPAPFANKGEVCDECNSRYVIPARLEGVNVSRVVFEPSKMYVIEVRNGEYVKNAKHDTKNLLEAKFFDSKEKAKNYISRHLPYGANIKLVEDCKTSKFKVGDLVRIKTNDPELIRFNGYAGKILEIFSDGVCKLDIFTYIMLEQEQLELVEDCK